MAATLTDYLDRPRPKNCGAFIMGWLHEALGRNVTSVVGVDPSKMTHTQWLRFIASEGSLKDIARPLAERMNLKVTRTPCYGDVGVVTTQFDVFGIRGRRGWHVMTDKGFACLDVPHVIAWSVDNG